MSMFPHTITLYTTDRRTGPESRDESPTNHITILRGVFFRGRRGISMGVSRETGAWVNTDDAVSVNIPTDAEIVDGITGAPKSYAMPREWAAASHWEREGLWTVLTEGGNGNKSFFVVGEVVEPDAEYAALRKTHDNVYQANSIRDRRFGGLPHWELGGV